MDKEIFWVRSGRYFDKNTSVHMLHKGILPASKQYLKKLWRYLTVNTMIF